MSNLEEKLETLRKIYPGRVLYKILVFGTPSEGSLGKSKNIIPILSSRISTITSIGTIMCDITLDFLSELALVVTSRRNGPFKSPGLKELEHPAESYNKNYLNKHFNVEMAISNGSNTLRSPTGSIKSVSGKSGPKPSSSSLVLSSKAKEKQIGRMKKYLGGMYLLAGRWQDALREFTEACTILKGAHDHLWLASALEGVGICLVLLSFLEVHITIPAIVLSITSIQSNAGESQIDLTTSSSTHPSGNAISLPPPTLEFFPELTNTLLRFYARSQSVSEESVPQIVYCETILRFANLLVVARLAGGWNPASLNAIFRGISAEQNITAKSPSIASIISWCNKAYATELSHLPTFARSRVYCGMAALYSSIGLVRKRTFMLRNLLVSLTPKIRNASSKVQNIDKQMISILHHESEDDVIQLLDNLCDVYGAGSIESVGYGWEKLRVSFLTTSLALCESQADFLGIVHFGGLLLSTSADALPAKEQLRIFKAITIATESAHKLGQTHVVSKYWDSKLLRDIDFTPTGTIIAPQYISAEATEDSSNVFLHNPYANKRNMEGSVDGQYNSKEDLPVLVQNEPATFLITLQNPFAFELHIVELTLLTDDFKVKATAGNLYIAPMSMFELSLATVPLQHGNLRVTGCKIHVALCQPHNFFLKSESQCFGLGDEKIKKMGVDAASNAEAKLEDIEQCLEINVVEAQPLMVLKSLSLNQGSIMLLEGEKQIFSITVANISDVETKHVRLHFSDSTIEPLKLVLANKAIPLNEIYEVEYFLFKKKAFEWKNSVETFENVSPHKTTEFQVQILGKRGMTSGTVQVEYSSKALASGSFWSRLIGIPINVTVNSSIELVGCDIIPLRQHDETFFMDQKGHSKEGNSSELFRYLKTATKSPAGGSNISDYCILVLDLKNSWIQPIEVTLWSSPNGLKTDIGSSSDSVPDDKKYTVQTQINADRTVRVLLPIKRINFNPTTGAAAKTHDFVLDQRIPSLSNRQFIMDSSSTPEKQRAMQEGFWYRESLLKVIGGSWKEVRVNCMNNNDDINCSGVDSTGSRMGELELRGLRLNSRMVNVLGVESVQIRMQVKVEEEAGVETSVEKQQELESVEQDIQDNLFPSSSIDTTVDAAGTAAVFKVKAEYDFVTISTTISNYTPNTLSGFLRLLPSQRYQSDANTPDPNQDASTSLTTVDPLDSNPYTSVSTITPDNSGGSMGTTTNNTTTSLPAPIITNSQDNLGTKILYNGTLQRPILELKPWHSVTVKLGLVFLSKGEYEWTSIFEVGSEETNVAVGATSGSGFGVNGSSLQQQSGRGVGGTKGFVARKLRRQQHLQRDSIYVKAN